MTTEPCDRCGDETAVGSPLFPGRHQGQLGDGVPVFRCGECAARDQPSHEQDADAPTGQDDWLFESMGGVAIHKQW